MSIICNCCGCRADKSGTTVGTMLRYNLPLCGDERLLFLILSKKMCSGNEGEFCHKQELDLLSNLTVLQVLHVSQRNPHSFWRCLEIPSAVILSNCHLTDSFAQSAGRSQSCILSFRRHRVRIENALPDANLIGAHLVAVAAVSAAVGLPS